MIAYCKHTYRTESSILSPLIASLENMGTMANRIKEVMTERGWEPPHVAKICGLKTPHAVYQWLDGSTKNLKNLLLVKFCQEAEVHIEWLVTGDQPKYKPLKLRKLEENFEHLSSRDKEILCKTGDNLAESKSEGNGARQ